SILLSIDGDTLRVAATNLEYAIEITLAGNGKGEGRVCVPARVLSAFVQSLKEDIVDLEIKNTHIAVKSALRTTRINCFAADDFPLIPSLKKHTGITLSSSLLQDGLEKVLPAVSLSGFKQELNGVFFRAGKQSLTLAATDTFRLAEKTITLIKRQSEEVFSFILPSRIASEMTRILKGDEDVSLWIDDNQALFETGDVKIISRTIDGAFPDYAGIVPKDFKTASVLQKNDLKDAIRSSSIFASKLQDVMMSCNDLCVEVSSRNNDVGEYKTKIPSTLSGDPLIVSFNYRYMLDGINSLHENEVFFGCSGEGAPALLRNTSDNSFIYVVMPIRSI
ncbi:MAG: DNA polymerase III subunit beta, partial [Candidatus Colwellbacteria bacterium]|nr:DNA polymerase III subunit beta [Candidatus Colwellbacteria bacterium]